MAGWQCGSCGGENPDGMRFCGHCGTPAAAPASSGPQAAPPPSPTLEPERPPPAEDREAALTAFASDRIQASGAGMTEERRLITALFADLSGFTPLSERLDTEELLEVIDPIITALSDVVARYGGYVEKFAGDALLALFGAPVAHEDDATRALLVSVDMHRALADLRTTLGSHGEGLTLHIGIASGRGIARMIGNQVRMDYAVLGDSVILAQRLESATPSGQTYISESTHELVQDRFELEPVPPLTLKGKSEPVPAWRLLGVRAADDARSSLVGRRQAPLVGRDAELDAVAPFLAALADDRSPGVVWVTGEPGVGKSRLTDEIRGRAAAAGSGWMEMRCISYGAGLAYWPVVDLLRRELGIPVETDPVEASNRLDAELGRAGVPAAAPYVARLMGLPHDDAVDEMDPEAFRRTLHESLAAWLRARAATMPIVLALEDAHWADASTGAAVAAFAGLIGDAPIGLYLTSRPPMPSWAPAAADAARIHVGELDAAAIRRLVDHVLDGPAPPGLAAAVARRSGGNPFFAEEIVRSLQDGGVVERDEGGHLRLVRDWDTADAPTTVEGVLAARLDALPTPAQATLGVASVIGRRVAVPLLERVADEAPERVDADLTTLLAARLLDPVDVAPDRVVLFHHALIAEVAYSRMLRRRRRELHRRTAEAAEALYGTSDDAVELLARHLYLGEAGSRAVDYLLRAGRRAKRLFANDEALVHLRRAEEVAAAEPEASARLLEIRLELADLQELIGAYEDALGTYRRALDLGPDVRAWRGLAAVHRTRGEYAEALRILDDAFAAVDLASQDRRPLWLERGWALTSTDAMHEATAALREGLAAGAGADDALAGQLLIELARAESYAGELTAALDHAHRALEIAQEGEDIRAETTALRVLGLVQHGLGRLDAAAASLRRGLELGRRIGSVEAIGGHLINLGLVERDRGNTEDAIRCDREAIAEFERVGHGAGRAIGYANLADKLRRAGELDEAEAYARRAHDLADEIGHAMTRADSVQILGEISLARGDHAAAVAQAERSADLFLAADARPGAAEAYELAERAWRSAGDEERAADAAARVRELSEEAPG